MSSKAGIPLYPYNGYLYTLEQLKTIDIEEFKRLERELRIGKLERTETVENGVRKVKEKYCKRFRKSTIYFKNGEIVIADTIMAKTFGVNRKLFWDNRNNITCADKPINKVDIYRFYYLHKILGLEFDAEEVFLNNIKK